MRPLRPCTHTTHTWGTSFTAARVRHTVLPLQIPSVSQTATNAMAKLASYTPELAEEVVTTGCLPDIVATMKLENVRPHRAPCCVFVSRRYRCTTR